MDEKQLGRFIKRVMFTNEEETPAEQDPAPAKPAPIVNEDELSEEGVLALIKRSLFSESYRDPNIDIKRKETLNELYDILKSQHVPENFLEMVKWAVEGLPETSWIRPDNLDKYTLKAAYESQLYEDDDRC